jgi:tetratricopeptide (TPR) repeat protein
VVITSDGPAVHVWDLRAIRRRLAEMGLDWNAPAYPETGSATENTAASPLHVVIDLGPLATKVQSLLQQEQVKTEVEPLVQQAQQLEAAGKIGEAIAARRQVARLSPAMAGAHNNLAWLLATAPEPFRNPAEAVEHARRAVELVPGEQLSLNTLGVALYRAGKFTDSIETLQKSLAAGKGQLAAFDLFFLAMAHHRLGHREEARGCYDRAMRWLREQKSLDQQYAKELAGFRGEAEAVLAMPAGELPAELFAPPR